MLFEIMKSIKNYFLTGEIHAGTFTIEDGKIELPFLMDGDYFMITGSRRNNGVYVYGVDALRDETFAGEIAILAPPSDFISLCDEIVAYNEKMAQMGVFQSESFGGYSYSIASGSNGGRATWQDAYRTRLNAWRKL